MTTLELLPLTVLSHRIYTIILRILHNRLVIASELDSHSLLFECFHPSAKLTEPPFFCNYLGTDGLARYDGYAEDDKYLSRRLGEMRTMYSRFQPHRRELEPGGRRVRRPPGDIPGSRTFTGTTRDGFEGEAVKQIVGLDGHELFTQLVAQTNLAKLSTRNGLFSSFVAIEEGVIRVWREWLREMATKTLGSLKPLDDERILWVSPAKNTGIRFNVRERQLRRDVPILVRADEEDMPVSYEIEYEGKRSSRITSTASADAGLQNF